MFLRNVGICLQVHMAEHPRRPTPIERDHLEDTEVVGKVIWSEDVDSIQLTQDRVQ
jgi:hypothetical protein